MESEKTLVISAFWGTGKSTFKERYPMCYDYDEQLGDALDDKSGIDPYEVEVNRIRFFIRKGIPCLVSAHPRMVDALIKLDVKFILIHPNDRMKETYIARYKARRNDAKFMRDIHANYDRFIERLNDVELNDGSNRKVVTSNVFLSDLVGYHKKRGFYILNPESRT